jgi:hypothetical protein
MLKKQAGKALYADRSKAIIDVARGVQQASKLAGSQRKRFFASESLFGFAGNRHRPAACIENERNQRGQAFGLGHVAPYSLPAITMPINAWDARR